MEKIILKVLHMDFRVVKVRIYILLLFYTSCYIHSFIKKKFFRKNSWIIGRLSSMSIIESVEKCVIKKHR
jgi:hypothetical protein